MEHYTAMTSTLMPHGKWVDLTDAELRGRCQKQENWCCRTTLVSKQANLSYADGDAYMCGKLTQGQAMRAYVVGAAAQNLCSKGPGATLSFAVRMVITWVTHL